MKLTELEALAKAATPGPWIGAGPSFGRTMPVFIEEVVVDRPDEEDDCFTICQAPATVRECSTSNMTFIAAANPTTILKLIALVRAVENLVKVKGRCHSEKAYIALRDAFDKGEGGE